MIIMTNTGKDMDKEEPYTAGVTDAAAMEISMEERAYGPVTLPMERTTKP